MAEKTKTFYEEFDEESTKNWYTFPVVVKVVKANKATIVDCISKCSFWELDSTNKCLGEENLGENKKKFERKTTASLFCFPVRLDSWLTQTVKENKIILVGYESVNKAKVFISLTVEALPQEEDGCKITFIEKGLGPTLLMKLGASKVKSAHTALLETFAKTFIK